MYECLVQTKNQHGFGELSDLHQWFTSQKGRPFVSANTASSFNIKNNLIGVILSCVLLIFIHGT